MEGKIQQEIEAPKAGSEIISLTLHSEIAGSVGSEIGINAGEIAGAARSLRNKLPQAI